jgi:hypothetical protein
MNSLKPLAQIFLGLIIIVMLAITAAVLPKSSSENSNKLFSIESEKKVNVDIEKNELLDFLFFTLTPKKIINPYNKSEIKEVTQISRPLFDLETLKNATKRMATENGDEDNNFILMENQFELIRVMVAQQYDIRVAAAKQQNPTGCMQITNIKAQQKCKNEIIFQKAVVEGKPEWCDEIQTENLKTRCVNSF